MTGSPRHAAGSLPGRSPDCSADADRRLVSTGQRLGAYGELGTGRIGDMPAAVRRGDRPFARPSRLSSPHGIGHRVLVVGLIAVALTQFD